VIGRGLPGPSPDVGDDGTGDAAVKLARVARVAGIADGELDRRRRPVRGQQRGPGEGTGSGAHGCPGGSGGQLGKAGVAVVGQRGEQLPVRPDHDERPAAGELGDL
jgi:hypothetical protein